MDRFDCVLVGGGLASSLIALALLERTPRLRLALVERGPSLGGNHTWSFHEGDVPTEAWPFVAPLVVRTWPGYEVAFPGLVRSLSATYSAVSSASLDAVVRHRFEACPNAVLYTGCAAEEVLEDRVSLEGGFSLEGRLVVDARGPERFDAPPACGYQKFVGLELALRRPAVFAVPKLMDACVPQTDGFRFFYTLPLAADRLLVEDTYYSDDPSLDAPGLEQGIFAYAAKLGVAVDRVVRRESGVLPLPTRSSPVDHSAGPLRAGYHGGWFHPTTGYSFPMAVRLALHVAAAGVDGVRGPALDALTASHERQARFCHLLNRLLFAAVRPEDRWNVLARFYRLPEATIRRFYAMETTTGDRARIVCGRPPQGLSLRAALAQGMAT